MKKLAVNDYGQAGNPEDLYKRYSLDLSGIKNEIMYFLSIEE